ncbi:MAG TPA: SMP-30/gluconolactonase/LRE family protein [Solirubrobacteraceae bacterium]|nr:SMP-30/gluconolactonase/LRE family protein [Solirubrobacteraceae bacterium]
MADSELDLLAAGFAFLESPRWKAGRLWAADLFASQILAFSPGGEIELTLNVPGTPAGLGWDATDRLHVLTADGRMLAESHGQLIERPHRIDRGSALCNEMTFDAHGRLFVGIFGLLEGALRRVDPDGTQRTVATDLLLPNGQALTADGQTLILAESAGQRLTAFSLTPDGQLTDRRVWASFGPPASATSLKDAVGQLKVWPDGIALDATGGVWVADPFGHEVIRVLEGGQVTNRVSTGALTAYGCALGGNDGRTLYICAAPPSLHETTRRTQRSGCLVATHVIVPATPLVTDSR